MKRYKFITIEQKSSEKFNGKPVYRIINNRSGKELGILYYYASWKQYVFTQSQEGILFSIDCLNDIIDFIKGETSK
jgi:hypothetical protein